MDDIYSLIALPTIVNTDRSSNTLGFYRKNVLFRELNYKR
jgi:hypothetical protein